jgi:4-diphosphocytidyl-2-C-methyl-D-erythritol kinase
MTCVRQSPAKVNLFLNVLGRRADGYHELETILHPLAVHDTLYFEPRPMGIQLTCNDPALPVDGRNLVWRAAERFFAAAGVRAGVRIHLEKRIPQGAGLGGGSANAAVTLRALNEMFERPLSDPALHELAAGLGSDVPFFLLDRPALATGRGECLEAQDWFPALRGCAFLVVHPGFGISTAWAYGQLARFPALLKGAPGRARQVLEALQGSDVRRAAAGFFNSFEGPAFEKFPVLELYCEFLRDRGALAARMTGSGSAVFALVRDLAAAEAMVEPLRSRFGAGLWTAAVPVVPC